MSDADRKL